MQAASREISNAQYSDKEDALNVLDSPALVETIDALPVDTYDLGNDALTVTSGCLAYRNFEVDVSGHVAPEPT